MKVRTALLLLAILCAFSWAPSLDAAYIFRNGKLIDANDIATFSLEEHYDLGIMALKKQDWDEAVRQFRVVTINFPEAALATESYYFLGVAYYHVDEMDFADDSFSEYLKKNATPKYFQETFQYKLAIADAFKAGSRKHLFGSRKLPQWLSGKDEAITLYNEIASTFPNQELGAKALLAKADLLRIQEEYRPCIETYQTVIRKFPRSEFAASSYVAIADVYLEQAKKEHQNPDLLALAQISLKKFGEAFPRDERVHAAEKHLQEMRETFAQALYETGSFYERKKEPKASILYYSSVISQFPETEAATLSKKRMDDLKKYADEMHLTTPKPMSE